MHVGGKVGRRGDPVTVPEHHHCGGRFVYNKTKVVLLSEHGLRR